MALTMDMSLHYCPQRYVYLASLSNMLKNISWIILGAINAKCFLNIADATGTDIAEVYTRASVINTLASSAGLYCGTKMASMAVSRRIFMASPILATMQGGAYYSMLVAGGGGPPMG